MSETKNRAPTQRGEPKAGSNGGKQHGDRAAIGVQTTLVLAGVLGGLVTLAGLFLPGMRRVERDVQLRPGRSLAEYEAWVKV